MFLTMAEMNDNILSNKWKERYNAQSEEVKAKLDALSDAMVKDYQLQVIKRSRTYPEIGDIFKLCPRENIEYYGIVVNNHVNNNNGDDQLVIFIFRDDVDIREAINNGVKEADLLIRPAIVTRGYWSKGLFYNVDHMEITRKSDYGFYNICNREFADEYGNNLEREPSLLGGYGITTFSGIAYYVNREMIISGLI